MEITIFHIYLAKYGAPLALALKFIIWLFHIEGLSHLIYITLFFSWLSSYELCVYYLRLQEEQREKEQDEYDNNA